MLLSPKRLLQYNIQMQHLQLPPPKQDYASIVAQKIPENNTYKALANLLGTEYEGPTSLYKKAPTKDPLTQTPVHGSTSVPVLDTNSPFVVSENHLDTTTQPMQYIARNNNKKRVFQASPNQSPTPQKLPSTNSLNMLINPQSADDYNIPPNK